MTYQEKLKDPRWQKKRLEILNEKGWACELCGNKEKALNVHHAIYLRDRSSGYKKRLDPWDYENKYLRVLCDECHEFEHSDDPLLMAADYLIYLSGYTRQELRDMLYQGEYLLSP